MKNGKRIEDFLHYFIFEKEGHLAVKVYKPLEKPRTFGIITNGETGLFEITLARESTPLRINMMSDSLEFIEEDFSKEKSLENGSLLVISKNHKYLVNKS